VRERERERERERDREREGGREYDFRKKSLSLLIVKTIGLEQIFFLLNST